VHQILSFERVHEVQETKTSQKLNSYTPSRISDLIEYGPHYLKPDELKHRIDDQMNEYYLSLTAGVLSFRDQKFWSYHRARLEQLGYPLDKVRLSKTMAGKILDLSLNPKHAIEKFLNHK
jgi:hypothetical protein